MTKNILIVDDSESIREVIKLTLEKADYNVLIGVDGQDAQKHLNGKRIDIIITDLHMPVKNGIELIKEVRANSDYQYTPVVFFTTETQPEMKQEAKDAGATGWIVKPYSQEKLLAVVKKLLR